MHDFPNLGQRYGGSIQFPYHPNHYMCPANIPPQDRLPEAQLLVQQETNSYQPSQDSPVDCPPVIKLQRKRKREEERDVRLLNAEIGSCAKRLTTASR
jgi:hypothetical protein